MGEKLKREDKVAGMIKEKIKLDNGGKEKNIIWMKIEGM